MITVLTASLPERAAMLERAAESVARQTVPVDAHLIAVDENRKGAARVYNDLASGVRTEWMTFLDDDDRIDPDHIATLIGSADSAVDVVYNACRFEGPHEYDAYNLPFAADVLRQRSIVPITAAVRTSLFHKVGGFEVDKWGYDWDLWQRVSDIGGRFVSTGKVTWTYVRHGSNQSHGELG